MQTLTAFQFNRFGYPSRSAFPDQRTYPILAVFQAKLKAIENEIDRRNLTRFTPYIFLKPLLIVVYRYFVEITNKFCSSLIVASHSEQALLRQETRIRHPSSSL